MKKFFSIMRNAAFFVVILIFSFLLVIVVTRNTKISSKDYFIEVMSEKIEVHFQSDNKTYYLEKDEEMTDNYVTVLIFSIYDIEKNPIHLTVKEPNSTYFAITQDGENVTITR